VDLACKSGSHSKTLPGGHGTPATRGTKSCSIEMKILPRDGQQWR